MPDVYTTIVEQDDAVVEQLATAMELRAQDPVQQAFIDEYLADVKLPTGSTVVEIGCGTGAIARILAARPEVATVVGIDPSPVLIRRGQELSDGDPSITFHTADGGAVPLEDSSADAVVLHTVLSHAPDPYALLVEGHRLLRRDGTVVVFDGDYATVTLAIAPTDPLQACAVAFQGNYINDPYVMRRAVALARTAGFVDQRVRSHGYVQVDDPTYMLSIADRGADALAAAGTLDTDGAAILKAEARRRVEERCFFGHIAYMSLIARKPRACSAQAVQRDHRPERAGRRPTMPHGVEIG